MAEASQEMTHDDHGHHSNTVALLGREITVEGGIYTVVFGGLAILTVIEVVSAEFLKGAIHDAPSAAATLTAIKAILLLAIAVVKSTLVIWFLYAPQRREAYPGSRAHAATADRRAVGHVRPCRPANWILYLSRYPQGNRMNSAGLYSVQNITTEYTGGTEYQYIAR